MKGIIFDVAADVVRAGYGDDVWDDLLDEVGIDGAYTALGSYPDAELLAIIDAAASRIGSSPGDTMATVGRLGYPVLAGRLPALVAGIPDLRTCLASLNTIIHPEVLKLYPEASPPAFELTDDGDDLLLRYISARGMCRMAEGLALGAADSFGERIEITHDSCRAAGDPDCVLRLRWLARS